MRILRLLLQRSHANSDGRGSGSTARLLSWVGSGQASALGSAFGVGEEGLGGLHRLRQRKRDGNVVSLRDNAVVDFDQAVASAVVDA
jgi:hypothetical protein